MGKWLGLGVLGVLVIFGFAVSGSYNSLVSLDQAVQSQWGQVETVKGAAAFEKDTFTAVTEARSRVGQVSSAAADKVVNDREAFEKFQRSQDALSSALSRLLVVVEKYPDLKATQNFRDLQAQLEGTENRIAVERMRFNEAAQAFNTKRNSFPTVLIAGFFGSRFAEKQYFKAQPGAETAPKVQFQTR